MIQHDWRPRHSTSIIQSLLSLTIRSRTWMIQHDWRPQQSTSIIQSLLSLTIRSRTWMIQYDWRPRHSTSIIQSLLSLTIRSRTWMIQHDWRPQQSTSIIQSLLSLTIRSRTWVITTWLASTTVYLHSIVIILPFVLERGRFSMTGVHDVLPSFVRLHLSFLGTITAKPDRPIPP